MYKLLCHVYALYVQWVQARFIGNVPYLGEHYEENQVFLSLPFGHCPFFVQFT